MPQTFRAGPGLSALSLSGLSPVLSRKAIALYLYKLALSAFGFNMVNYPPKSSGSSRFCQLYPLLPAGHFSLPVLQSIVWLGT